MNNKEENISNFMEVMTRYLGEFSHFKNKAGIYFPNGTQFSHQTAYKIYELLLKKADIIDGN